MARDNKRSEKVKLYLGALAVILVCIMCIFLGKVIKKYTPSKERLSLNDYFKIEEADNINAAIILDNTLIEDKIVLEDGVYYISMSLVKNSIDDRFYYDEAETKLFYTIPTGSFVTTPGDKAYYFDDKKNDLNAVAVLSREDSLYIELSYLKMITGIDYETFDNPNRVMINTKTKELETAIVKKDTQLRYRGGIKSPILKDMLSDTKVYVLSKGDGWCEIITDDGIRGYIKKKHLKDYDSEKIKVKRTKIEERHEFFDKTISMAWHQVFTRVGRSDAMNAIQNASGLNVVSPTWFYLNDNKGGIVSYCSKDYVEYCHSNGVEVWALVNNFENKDVDTYEVLSKTTTRENLISALISKAIEYKLDGINVDFESLKPECGEAYIEFIRELSIRCHNNGITLSVDNYVPSDYTSFYNRSEQAIFADYVIIMAYDEHYAGSSEGSVSSIGYVENGIADTLKEVPAEQIIVGLPFYTRIWELTPIKTDEGDIISYDVKSKAVGMLKAEKAVADNNAKVTFDKEAGQNYAEYEKNGITYMIWLEDEDSLKLKLEKVKQYEVKGVSFWKLGFEKSTTYNTITKYIH